MLNGDKNTSNETIDEEKSIKRSNPVIINTDSMWTIYLLYLEPKKQAKTTLKLFKPPQLSRPNVVTEDTTQWSNSKSK